MKAMLFAAGLGTRLRPLTDHQPKAMVALKGKPLLQLAIERLMAAGCTDIIVNVHHFSEQIFDFLAEKASFGIRIAVSDETPQLLDTGGGLKKAAWFFQDERPFLVCNTDVLTDMNLGAFYLAHCQSGALATLAVRHRATSRYFLFDEQMQLQGWQHAKTGETRLCRTDSPAEGPALSPWAFSGIHAISPAIFGWMPESAVFSIVDVYLKAAATERIIGYPHDGDKWLDVGRPDSLAAAAELF